MVYAIVRAGGRQEKVEVGTVVTLDRQKVADDGTVTLVPVLLVDGDSVTHAAADLAGVTVTAELPPESEDDVWTMSRRERRAMGYTDLPGSLEQALNAMEESELVAEALGEHVFEFFLRNKRREWDDYRSYVTPYELRSYLSL